MSENQNEPREYDAVRGGQNSIPVNAAVLGGIPGVKSRLASPIVEVKIAALSEALKYGEAGLDVIVQALREESMQVKFAAYSLLKDRDDLKIKPQFQDYLPTFEFDVITVDDKGKENSRIKSFAHYFREDLGNGVVLEMVYIPGGTFMMGSPATESGIYDRESPHHQVTVPAFYAGKYPITQAQWQAVMGNNPSHFRGEKLPVETLGWDKAVAFCRKISEKTGKIYRLLSESEWEYACRAGTATPFYFGETITTDLVNYNGNFPFGAAPTGRYREQTMDVGSFPPNPFGLYDMHGQVCEWCSDKWHINYDGAPIDGSSWETGTSNCRVLRGGSWYNYAVYCRAARRDWIPAGHSYRCRGFRVAVALTVPSSLSSL
ncbi:MULTISPECIES: formylglycine-generating enzyme family protein [unclassified Microcoleus]|uniref:formylglycine-generating enzyme family protein n=1 Tax=unclassified Microcoleus TaxID=2642155 RepID=UPI001D801A63|nr:MULTISPECIES: formylglycine-generating enzyme family protein [unclassified Microcoleus]MCC3440419.1 formylglycine-generating enzyme family protein [Microcoleus sp. PH2017_03_ELD_O_A]MCC3501680.1 formylglycine-generating enzyme family protein [Microcoleus sp. PH2017_19_SFW_U_A]TAE71151.1 MAG: formylglycine-generating enzyme family protein [Oscillatoriales cyanobacterium]MCC3453388.1 formylglycine-generating enzyme family protein [Microcoleus sp. PH2017_08_TRC_O_A]MCC3471447.1 formylglycine-g